MINENITIDNAEITKAITSATLRLQARLLKLDDLSIYLGCGKTYARHVAETAGAVRRLGSSWLCDRYVLDEFLNQRTGDIVPPAEVARWRGGKK